MVDWSGGFRLYDTAMPTAHYTLRKKLELYCSVQQHPTHSQVLTFV